MYLNEKEVLNIKRACQPGTQIVINNMNDPRPIPSGTKGVVNHVDDMGTIHCEFENGRRLGVVPGEDDFTIINPDKPIMPNEIQSEGLSQSI